MDRRSQLQRARRGGILISSLAFVAVTSVLVVGMLTLSVSFYARTQTESDYEAALALAEAGVNYEMQKISVNTANADQVSVGNPSGPSYTLGNGTFTVYCMNKDGTTPWTPPTNLYVSCTGTVNGASRTVKCSLKGYGTVTPTYAIFAINQGTESGGSTRINGSVATDGHLAPSGGAAIVGSVEFDGAGTGWNGSYSSGSPITFMPNPIVWPTVSALALAQYPAGGLGWLSTNNDNSLSPAIVSNKLKVSGVTGTLYGKAGGANYYLTDLDVSGGGAVAFDNTNGPITIWMGPVNGNGHSAISGGSAAIKNDSTRAVKIYSALKTTFTISGSSTFDGGIYVYDVSSGSNIGTFVDSGGSTLNGTVLANNWTVSGGSQINSTFTYFTPSGATMNYYGYDDSWMELNTM